MINIRNIGSVSRYERKILMRSWFFRIFSILSLVLLCLMNIVMFISPQSAGWTNRAVAANLPYMNVLLISVAQAILAIFLASDFIRRDSKLDTTETIYSRPVTNGEYVVGKILGIFSIFTGLIMLVLLITLIFNLVKQDTPVIWEAYLFYPLLISVPTLVFILGLSFLSMLLIKNQPVTFIVLLGYIGLTLFYLKDKFFGLWDYMAFNLPMIYSDLIGFAEPWKVILHRMTYLFLGVAFIFAAIRWMNRLPQTGKWNNLNFFLFLFFLISGGLSGYNYYRLHKKVSLNREYFKSVNERLAMQNVPDIISVDINLHHKGKYLEIASDLILSNSSGFTIDTINISLNPGFKKLQIFSQSKSVPFHREGQVVRIIPGQSLLPGDSAAFSLIYSGTPTEDVCYLDIPDADYFRGRKIMVINVGKRYGITNPEYVLLTPEILWYPVAGVTCNRKTWLPRNLDFVHYNLKVKTEPGLHVFSQGEKTYDSDGLTVFQPENDLPGLSLIIGRYEQKTAKTDSLEMNLAICPGHDFYSHFFRHIKDTIPDLIKEYKNQYEVETVSLRYPYKRVTLIEVPVQYHAYERLLSQAMENVQPELFLMPEKGSGLSTTDFARLQFMENRRNRRQEQARTPEEIERGILRRFITQTFFVESSRMFITGVPGIASGELVTMRGVSFTRNPYSAFPQYYSFKTGFVSDEFPVFNAMIEAYLNGTSGTIINFGGGEGMTETERANLALRDYSMEEIINSRQYGLIPKIISQKGYFLISSLKNMVGMNDFDHFLHDYVEKNKYAVIRLEKFREDFMKEFKVDINPYLTSINTLGQIPCFIFGDVSYYLTRDDYGPVYLVRFPVTNSAKVKGLLEITFESGGRRSPGGGGFSVAGEPDKRIVEIDSLQTREVQVMLYNQPRMMTINTIISENIPSVIRQFLRQPVNTNMDPVEYQKILNEPVKKNFENEIIVDNEDPGFSYYSNHPESKLKKYIQSRKKLDEKVSYSGTSFFRTPKKWTPVVSSGLYGQVRLSALITAGNKTGDQVARWKAILPSSSLYHVYVYLPTSIMRERSFMFGSGRGQRRESESGGSSGGGQQRPGRQTGSGPGGRIPDGAGPGGFGPGGMQRFTEEGSHYNYSIITKHGQEEVEFVLNNVADGWNKIGSFDLPADTVIIELSNNTAAKRVVADAVKFIKADNI